MDKTRTRAQASSQQAPSTDMAQPHHRGKTQLGQSAMSQPESSNPKLSKDDTSHDDKSETTVTYLKHMMEGMLDGINKTIQSLNDSLTTRLDSLAANAAQSQTRADAASQDTKSGLGHLESLLSKSATDISY